MQDFKVNAEIKHLNIRKEGEEREVLAIDVKVTATVEADLVDSLMCEDINDGDALRCFWLENETRDVRFLNMGEVKFTREYKSVKVDLLEMELIGCKVGKFSFAPMSGGRALLTFSFSAKEPPAYAVDRLASMLGQDIDVAFTMPQGDLFADGDDAGEAADGLDALAREDGGATLESGGKVLARFGK